MNTGMQDAFNMAWKLALTVRGKCGERVLDSYSPERSAIGDHVLKNASMLTKVATLRNPIVQTLRNVAGQIMLGIGPVRHEVAETMSEVTIGYPESPLNGPAFGGVPKPGQRVAPVAGQSPVGSGNAPLFVLFAEKSEAIAKLVTEFAGLLDPDIRPPLHASGIWLVRPDGYVACSSRDTEVIRSYLHGIMRPTI
jgi:hypothetical protein